MKNSLDNRPPADSLSWPDRCLTSRVVEIVVENKVAVIGTLLAVVVLVTASCLYFSRSRDSSVAQLFNAQHTVNILKGVEPSSVDKKEVLATLTATVMSDSLVAHAYAGIVAQEQLIAQVEPLSIYCFETAKANLIASDLPVQARIDEFSLLYARGEKDRLLNEITAQIESLEKENRTNDVPQAVAYLLVQQATVLKDLGRPTAASLKQLEQLLAAHPDVKDSFERIFALDIKGLFDFLHSP